MLLKTTRALARPGPVCDTSICHASVWFLDSPEALPACAKWRPARHDYHLYVLSQADLKVVTIWLVYRRDDQTPKIMLQAKARAASRS